MHDLIENKFENESLQLKVLQKNNKIIMLEYF